MKRVLAALLCAAGLTAAAPPLAARADPPALPVAGADLVSVGVTAGDLTLRARDAAQARAGSPGRPPGDLRFDAGAGFAGRVPDRGELAFLGAPGTPVWVLATEGDFPSFDATAVPRGLLAGDTVTLRLAGVEGPGRFHAYGLSSLGRVEPLLGSGGPATTTLRAGQRRAGVLWAFDAPGTYEVRLAASGTDAGGNQLGDEATYRVDVPEITPPPLDARVPSSAAAPAQRAAVLPEAASLPEAAPAAKAAPPKAAPPKAAPAKAAPATGRKVIADGHVDMGPQLEGDTWTVRLRDDTGSPPVWRELSDVVLHAVDKSKIEVPSGADYAFLGPAGSDVWMLPQAQQSGIVWPGWNTQDPSVVGGTTGDVTWRLTSVSGPGEFKLFLTGSFGKPDVLFDSGKALPQQLRIPPNTHAHGSWAFTKPGIYRLGIEMSGTTKAGRAVSDRRTLAVAVGAVDPQDAFGPGGGDDAGDNGDDGRLPRTGFSVVAAVGVGVLLVVAGTVLLRFARRRRTADR